VSGEIPDVGDLRGRLWSDEPSKIDFLAARAVAETISDAVLDDSLDPLAIGLSGPWGSGKTTVLELIKLDLDNRSDAGDGKTILTVRTDPWRYDPSVGAKESLIAEVLDVLTAELESKPETKTGRAIKLLKKLARRVDWAKAIKLAAKTSLALQIPSVDDLTDLIREPSEDEASEGEVRGLAGFRAEFEELMSSDELKHIRRVAVLVDDLDRCLVDTVVETLEAIRLFLSVKGMAFVIAADEERVAEAIRAKLPEWTMPEERPGGKDALPTEPPSKLYLHKIVQTTVPLPALGAFDTESYVLLLQLQNRVDPQLTDEQLQAVIDECTKLRGVGALDGLKTPTGFDIQQELAFAHRLTTILYEKFMGNPRRIKRFLNDLNIRRSIAARRGISLDLDVVAKLMVLEVLLPDQFQEVLSWLRTGELRDRLSALETLANTSKTEESDDTASADEATAQEPEMEETESASGSSEKDAKAVAERETAAPVAVVPVFSDDLIRWAKLLPDLKEIDLSPYLHLAASFSGDLLVSQELPQRLRDLSVQLMALRTVDRMLLSEDRLKALPLEDVRTLVRHLGLRARDRIQEQRGAVSGIGRLAAAHPSVVPMALDAFRRLPVKDLMVATAMHLRGLAIPGMEDVITDLTSRMSDGPEKKALTTAPATVGRP